MAEQSNIGWILVAAAVAAYLLLGSSDKDDLGHKIAEGERFYLVDFMSGDEEFIITNQVAAKNEKQAISRMKAHLKEKGENIRGGKWDADIDTA